MSVNDNEIKKAFWNEFHGAYGRERDVINKRNQASKKIRQTEGSDPVDDGLTDLQRRAKRELEYMYNKYPSFKNPTIRRW